MNKNFLLLLSSVLIGFSGTIIAQTVSEGELAVVYYMPQTQIEVEVEYEQETLQRGPFAPFAEEFLGAEEVVEEDEVNYSLIGARIYTRTQADYQRAYKVTASSGLQTQLLTLTSNGILAGYNILPETAQPQNKKKNNEIVKPNKPLAHPYLEDQMKAQTLREMAEITAKQIFRIRESRLYILSGEVDNPPADGKAMALVLEELNKQERQLTELFVGTRTIEKKHKSVILTPSDSEEKNILYFSETEGIVAEDNATATPVVLGIEVMRQTLTAAKANPDKKAPKASQIHYNLPGRGDVKVYYRSRILAERQMAIAQAGVAIPLAENLFTGKENVRISFDVKTGNIKSISK